MQPIPVPSSSRLLAALVATALVAGALSRVAADPIPRPKADGSIEARVILYGKPVPGVPLQVRNTGEPGLGVWVDDSTAVVDTTDEHGVAVFRNLVPGRYHVVSSCGRVPGDCIAGTISTQAEAISGGTGHATLTLRPGGRIVGRVVESGRPYDHVTIETQSFEALPSTCPTLNARNPGPDGRFEVGRVPLDTRLYVKVYRPLGGGDVQLWKEFTLTSPDTVEATWELPPIDSTQLATLELGVRVEGHGPAEAGRMELSTTQPDGWRYYAAFDFSAEDSLHTLPLVPPGRYGLRATARPGGGTWWNAMPESIDVAAGAKIRRLLTGRPPR